MSADIGPSFDIVIHNLLDITCLNAFFRQFFLNSFPSNLIPFIKCYYNFVEFIFYAYHFS